jgi:hypothetical protein
MRFLFYIFCLLFSLNFCIEVNAQIFMPAMRGAINSKPAITTTMYSGGIGNGSDIKSLIQSICLPMDVESIFYGGTGYSSSEKNLILYNCPPQEVESIFYGGIGYSSSEKNIIQTICPPLELESIFYGGTGYSSSEKNLIQGICTPLNVESIFKGGSGIGGTYLFKDNCTVLSIGDSYEGGKIAYILQTGDPGYDANVPHGIIAATADYSVRIRWNNGSNITTVATATALGTGLSNTNAIIAAQGAGSYAASVARNHNGGGYTDWHLPSKNELEKLIINKNAIGGFVTSGSTAWYYSSSESASDKAWLIYAVDGTWYANPKQETWNVRPIRFF